MIQTDCVIIIWLLDVFRSFLLLLVYIDYFILFPLHRLVCPPSHTVQQEHVYIL